MSAESFLAFYGVRLEVPDGEIALLDNRAHPIMIAARKNHLKHYWGDFAGPSTKRTLLFVGDNIGSLGLENAAEIQVSRDELIRRMDETEDRLRSAGIGGPVMLYLQWEPDA